MLPESDERTPSTSISEPETSMSLSWALPCVVRPDKDAPLVSLYFSGSVLAAVESDAGSGRISL